MKYFELPRKAGTSEARWAEIEHDIWNRQSSGGTYELAVRHMATVKGIQVALVRRNYAIDLVIRINGKQIRCEIKSGTGICAWTGEKFGDHISNYSEADILPKADLVIFAPGAEDFESLDQMLYESLVMTPERFAQFVIENSGVRKHGFGTAFKLGVDNKNLRAKNKAIAPRPVLDKQGNQVYDEDGNPKTTKRDVPRYTDCIVLQESYNNQLCEAVLVNAGDDLTLGQWLEDIGRA